MGGRRAIGWLLAVGAAAAGLSAAPAEAAVAHARMVGSAPADGTVVDRPPDSVVLRFDTKPATVEGDPVQVFSSSGARVDDGAAVTGRDGRELAVRLRADRPAGEYRVVYRIVSSDSHLIAGQLSFISVGPALAPAPAFAAAPAAESPPRLRQAVRSNVWPRLALLVAAGNVIAVHAARKRLRARAA